MFRTLMVILGVLVLIVGGAMIYMGPTQMLDFAGGLITTGEVVEAGSGSETTAPQASPEPAAAADGSKPETPGDINTSGQ